VNDQNKRTNAVLEIEHGEEALKEARVLLDSGLFRGAMSRTYYGAFHHVKALLFTIGLEAKTHEGASHLFNLHFVRPGLIDVKYARLVSRLQKYREQSDYDPAAVFTKEDVETEFQNTLEFSRTIKASLQDNGLLPPSSP
jgi:uncharacterized protein (UPF0332 family)